MSLYRGSLTQVLVAYFALLDMANILPVTRDEVDEAIRSVGGARCIGVRV